MTGGKQLQQFALLPREYNLFVPLFFQQYICFFAQEPLAGGYRADPGIRLPYRLFRTTQQSPIQR
jgi:hypothetical protein